MANSKKAVGLVVTLLVLGLLAAFLMPVVIDSMADAEEQTATLDTNETIVLQADLNATLDSTTAGTSATYTISNDADSASATVNVGANQTVTVDGTDVTIAVSEANSGNATATFSYPTDYGWGGGASSLWTILPLVLVLAVFLYITYKATRDL